LAEADPQIIAVTAAMAEGTGLAEFAGRFPERCFDVGIAEAHAVVFAAGLALGGLHPFVFIYSTFLQRAYDHIISDVALQQLPVVFMLDRAGIVGADGETHHGIFDLSYLGHIPGLTVLTPVDGNDLMSIMNWAAKSSVPIAIRYPKDLIGAIGVADDESAPIILDNVADDDSASIKLDDVVDRSDTDQAEQVVALIETSDEGREIAAFADLRGGSDVLILAVGATAQTALCASEMLQASGIDAAVTAVRRVSPLDKKGLMALVSKGMPILTVEDNVLRGGFGEAATACVLTEGSSLASPREKASLKPDACIQTPRMKCLGWKDEFIPQGSLTALRSAYGLDAEGLAKAVQSFLTSGGETDRLSD
jgi:1-deoxy-D-xylulose-5-phosphate synthase